MFGSADRVKDEPVGNPERYVYEDEDREPLFRVSRVTYESGKKSFYQNGADGRGGWGKGKGAMKDVRLVLWKLPVVLKAIKKRRTIHLTEGEKDAAALSEVGEIATCHPMGAGKWRAEYTQALTGAAQVVVWADRDAAGYRCANQRLTALLAADIPARAMLPIPDFKGADVCDHLAAGHTPQDGKPVSLDALLTLADDSTESVGDHVLRDVRRLFLASEETVTDHLDSLRSDDDVMALGDPEFIIDGWVPRGFFTVVFGEPGVKKTFALLGMSRAVRRGTRWQDNKTVKGSVLFYQGEGLEQLKPRIRAWDSRYPLREDQSMAAGAHTDAFVDLTKPEGVAAVARTVRGYEKQTGSAVEMLVIDPLVEFMTGEENGEGMDKATRGLRALALHLNIAVVVGHHTNAVGGRARGADFHRMRAGSHIHMEELDDGLVGMYQQKQKNSERMALIMEPVEHAESLVLEWHENLPATAYTMLRESGRRRNKVEAKSSENNSKRKEAEALLLAAIKDTPGLSRTALLKRVVRKGIGKTFLEQVLDVLTGPDIARVRLKEGARHAQLHYLA